MSNFEKLRDAPLHVLADPGGRPPKKSKMALFGPQETDKFPATRPLKKMSEIFFEGIPKKVNHIFISGVVG